MLFEVSKTIYGPQSFDFCQNIFEICLFPMDLRVQVLFFSRELGAKSYFFFDSKKIDDKQIPEQLAFAL